MELKKISSSAIKSIAYDKIKSILIIEFNSGPIWEYLKVSPKTYEEFLASESKGRFFQDNIKDVYEQYKIG